MTIKNFIAGVVLAGTVAVSGLTMACGTPFIGIRPMEDGSYMITRTRHGVFRNQGIVERCVPNAEQMMCQLIDRW